MDVRTLHLCQSVSKSICATSGAILIDKGILDPNELVTKYLPELSKTAWKGAKIQHVLDMTSGVKFVETYEERESDIGKMDYASGWKPAPYGVDSSSWPKTIWEQILSLKIKDAEHGERHEYRSIRRIFLLMLWNVLLVRDYRKLFLKTYGLQWVQKRMRT